MLCYVGGTTRKYFKWEDNQWSEFSSGNGGGNSLIFRVDTIEDRDSINTITLEYGSLCHVLNDVNFRYMYYYGKNGWTPISHEYQVWIGKEPPEDKKSLWVDTRIIEADPNKQNTYPPIIKYLVDLVNRQNNTIINLSSQISILENEIDLIKQAIENGGGGIVDNNIYLTTEDDKIFITEDGIPIITEEGNTEPPTKPPTETIDRILLTEDGNHFITEDGKYFELETKTPTSDSSGDEGDTNEFIVSYTSSTETLNITSNSATVSGETLIINNDKVTVSGEKLIIN